MARSPRLLVTGAAGHFGRLVLEELIDKRDVAPDRIIATSRKPETLADMAERGVEVRYADYDEPESLAPAVRGADRLLLVPTKDVQIRGARTKQNTAVIDAAVAEGVRHVVFTSGPDPAPPNIMYWAIDAWETEEALRESQLSWTILRDSEWMEAHVDTVWWPLLDSGELRTAAGGGRCPYVSRADCARVAAVVLDSTSEESELYDLSGPQSLTIDEAMAVISEVASPMKVTHVDPEDFAKQLRDSGQPEWLVRAFVALDEGISSGRLDIPSDAVEKLTGVPPMSLRDYVAAKVRAS